MPLGVSLQAVQNILDALLVLLLVRAQSAHSFSQLSVDILDHRTSLVLARPADVQQTFLRVQAQQSVQHVLSNIVRASIGIPVSQAAEQGPEVSIAEAAEDFVDLGVSGHGGRVVDTVDHAREQVEEAFGVVELQGQHDCFAVVVGADVVLQFLVLLDARGGLRCGLLGREGCGVGPEGEGAVC